MAKIPDPKEIQAQIDRLVNRQIDEKIEGKPATTAPAKGAVSDPFAGMKKETPRADATPPTPPAAAAPSAPVAGGPTPEARKAPGSYVSYIEYEYVGEPDPDSSSSMPSEEMNYTAGQKTPRGGMAIAPAVKGDKRSNIEKVIAGERTSTSRQYAPKKGVVPGANLLLTVLGKPAAVVRITAVYAIKGSAGGDAILQDSATGTEVRKPIEELAASEGYDPVEYAKRIYNTTVKPGEAAGRQYMSGLNEKAQAAIDAQAAPAEAPSAIATGEPPYPLMDRSFQLESTATARDLQQSMLGIADGLGVANMNLAKGSTEGGTYSSEEAKALAKWVLDGINEIGRDPSAQRKFRNADWQTILRRVGFPDGYGNNINEIVRYIRNSAPGTQGMPLNNFSPFTSPAQAPAAPVKAPVEAPVEAPARRATSIGMAPDEVSAPPMGETPASVAPTALPEAVAAPAPTPKTQVTASTPLESPSATARGKIIFIDSLDNVPVGEIAVWGSNTTNMERGGGIGQAASAKGRKGWIAIPTKLFGKRTDDAFLTDEALKEITGTDARSRAMKKAIDGIRGAIMGIKIALADGKNVYMPSNGVGTGEAQLRERAPELFKALTSALNKIINETDTEGRPTEKSGLFAEEKAAKPTPAPETKVTAPTRPDATVAQGKEQGTSKPLAAGSNPAGGATPEWALFDITDRKLMGFKAGMLLDVDSSQNICLTTSGYWAQKMEENGFSNARSEWLNATSPYLPEDGVPYLIGHKVAVGEKDGKTFILDLPQSEFITMGEAAWERVESFMNNAESMEFSKFKQDEEMSDWIKKEFGEEDWIDTRGGNREMVMQFLDANGENIIRTAETENSGEIIEGTYNGTPWKIENGDLELKPKKSMRVVQDQLRPRLVEIDPKKDLTKEYAKGFALPKDAVEPENPITLPSEPEVKTKTAASKPSGGAKNAFSSMKATPEQIRAASAPSDTDFGVAPDAPEYTLPETDGRYVGIIGTAGRGEDGARLTESDYRALVEYFSGAVKPNDVLISGGAAWSDHVAVQLFLDGKVGGLVLHLPAEIIAGPNGKLTFKNAGFGSSGNTANYYHTLFNKALKVESDASLKQIQEAIDRGATVTYGDGTKGNEGMKERNSLVARDSRDFLIAMTFDPDTERQMPRDGGTADTWRKHFKGHPGSKRRLIDIRERNPDPSERGRVLAFLAKKGKYKLTKTETEEASDIFKAMAKAEGEEDSLLDKASKRMTDSAMMELTPQGMQLQQDLQAMQTEQTGQLKRALRIAYLPTDKLVSAAVLIAMLKSPAGISPEIVEILEQGMMPNIAALKRSAGKDIDVEAAIRFMRDRMLFSTIEIGKGEDDALITRILENAGVPRSAFAKTGPDAPAYTFPDADAEAAEVRIKRVDADLKRVSARIQKTSADLGPLMSHPEVARRVYLVTSLLAGVEQDIQSEFAGEALPSRLRTDKDTGIPYIRKLEDIDPIFEYIRMRADISPSEVFETESNDRDPYAIADAVIAAGAKAPVSRGKRGRYTYDEAQLYATYKSETPYRRYAFDLNGEVHPLYMELDELGLVTDKFDGFENPYAGFASLNDPNMSRQNRSPAMIGMHISADSSARVTWVDRVPNKEIDVLRAIKKLISDKNPMYVLPGTPDEIVILPGAFMRYTREADMVNQAADQVSADVQAAMGKIYLVDVSLGDRAIQQPFVIDGVTYYIGKGMYAFKEGDETGIRLAEEMASKSTDGYTVSNFVSKPFKLGDKAQYPEVTGLGKFFRIDIDPVVHMTFAHNDPDLVTRMDALRYEEDFDEDQQIYEPLKPASGGKFEGQYLLSETQTASDDIVDFTDRNPGNIEFDDGLRFVVGNNIQLNRTLDGVDLIEDAYDEIYASEVRQNLPISLTGAERRAAAAELRVEQGLDPVSEDMSETDKAYRNYSPDGDSAMDHFGRSFSFEQHEEYSSDSVFADESVAATRLRERMKDLNARGGNPSLTGTPDPLDVERVAFPDKTLPQFKLEDFMRPEALTPEAEAMLERLVADYFYILRVRARDVSQMVPNPKFVEREGQVGWRRLREAVRVRSELLKEIGYGSTLRLHRYQTREPAIFNAVLFEIFATTGDRLDVANEVAKEVYTHIEQEESLDSKGRGTLVSTKAGRYSFRADPIVDDVDALARLFAVNVAKSMLRERKFKPYEKSAENMSLREQYLDAEADQMGASSDTSNFTRDYQGELSQIAAESGDNRETVSPYVGVEVGESLEHTLGDGRKVSGSTEEGRDLVRAIMDQERSNDQLDVKFNKAMESFTEEQKKKASAKKKSLDEAGQKRLNNLVSALETLEEEAAIKSLRKRIAPAAKPAMPKSTPPPTTDEVAILDYDSNAKRVLGGLTKDQLRAFASRAWVLYSEHLANDGDRDAFVKMINRALSNSTTVKGKQNKLNQIMNFVFDNNGTVVVPDEFFTDEKGNKSYPEPKIKNPQYSSASRRANAFDGTFAIDEMEKFVKSVLGKSKTSRALGEIIRYAKLANNFTKDKKKQLRFYVTTDPRTGLRKFFLSVAPTYASQKRVVTPYAPGGPEADQFNDPFATMATAKQRLQSMSAQDMESLFAGNGVDSAIRVVRRESPILNQAEGTAQAEDFSKAQPYDLVFNSEFDVDQISGSMLGEMPDHVRGDDRAKVLKTVLDASVRARFFQILKASLEVNGLDSSFITEEDIDPSAFKSVETPEGTKYALKPRIEQDGTFAGPFSRSGKGPVRTLKLRDIDGDERISRVMNMLLEQIKGGDSYAEQSDMDEAANQVRKAIDFRSVALEAGKGKPRFSPGAKAGIAGGTIAGTIAAYLQFGADEQAGDMALQTLPSQVAFEALGAIPKVGGPVAAATGLGLTYATGGDMLRALAGITGSVVGGIAGTGAGLFTGPGAFVSGLAGSTAGYMLADSLYSSVSGKSSPMPSNVARSNPVVDEKMDNPSVRTVTPEAPMPVVNRDLAKLEEMGG